MKLRVIADALRSFRRTIAAKIRQAKGPKTQRPETKSKRFYRMVKGYPIPRTDLCWRSPYGAMQREQKRRKKS